jgi:hypothetical protein
MSPIRQRGDSGAKDLIDAPGAHRVIGAQAIEDDADISLTKSKAAKAAEGIFKERRKPRI